MILLSNMSATYLENYQAIDIIAIIYIIAKYYYSSKLAIDDYHIVLQYYSVCRSTHGSYIKLMKTPPHVYFDPTYKVTVKIALDGSFCISTSKSNVPI